MTTAPTHSPVHDPTGEQALDVVHAGDPDTRTHGWADLSLAEAATAILSTSVHLATGSPTAKPRDGQVTMMADIVNALSQPDGDGQALAEGPTGIGKALDVDTPIPTPAGWTRMGDLYVGAVVFDENGQPCRVTHVHPVRLDRDCYQVEFADGSTIVADVEHLWATLDDTRIGYRVMNTGQMAAAANDNGNVSFDVPTPAPLRLPDVVLPRDPYLTGAWIGIAARNPGDVHIPAAYLRGSVRQRTAVLQGIWFTTRSNRDFTTTNELLARQVVELMCSIGMTPTLTSGPVWRVTVSPHHQRRITRVTAVDSRPVRCITVDSPNHLFLAGDRMTPTHNSLVYLTAAAASFATTGNRSVVSTESLALQAQLTDKDAPVVVAACDKVTGIKPKVAVLKGWGNFACAASAVDTGNTLLDRWGRVGAGQDPRALAAKLTKATNSKKVQARLAADPVEKEKADLTVWALTQVNRIGGPGVTGDKNSYPGNLSDSLTWESVSVASGDCLGADRCPFSDVCLPRAAREKAAEADIVVTNHTLLGVQAANDIPVVVGSKTLGRFDHLFIDEAHGLPQTVRGQGSVEVSARAVRSVARTLERTLDDHDPTVETLLKTATALADYVENDLHAVASKGGRTGVVRLGDGDDPLENAAPLLARWLEAAGKMLTKAAKLTGSHAAEIALRRAKGRVSALADAVNLVTVHEPGSARWVETVTPHSRAADQTPYPVARYTPVDVAPMLRRSVYTREMTDDELDESGYGAGPTPAELRIINAGGFLPESTAPDGPPPRKPLSVVALSATIPTGFSRQIGVRAQPVFYPSPFDTAYGNSVLFVPRVAPTEVAALTSDQWGKAKFDTKKHKEWALRHILDLVEANGGSALVLSATATAGREYADALRSQAAGRWDVMSQWDGAALRRQVAAWKDNRSAVLVGTRSLMTGVDASGDTCTLVIVDRPPRAASNPVDDARVEMLVANASMDKWAADRLTYVADAGLLLEQAAGRLIRSVDDAGMVAVLDPRLLKSSPFPYPEPTRRSYLETLRRFEEKIADPAAARAWLNEHRTRRGKP